MDNADWPSDSTFYDRILNVDKEAWNDLFILMKPDLLAQGFDEDLVSELYAEKWRSLAQNFYLMETSSHTAEGRHTIRRQLWGYILRAMSNLAADEARSRRRNRLSSQNVSEISEEEVADSTDELSPSEAAIKSESVARLRTAVTSLTDEDRTLIEMRFDLDLTLSQIAENLGVSVSTVFRRLHTIIRRLEIAIRG